MAVAYGARINDDTNFITEIDIDNNTCETTGYVNGEAVDFSGGGGGSSDFTTAEITFVNSESGTIAYVVSMPYIPEAPNNDQILVLDVNVDTGEPVTLKVPLYKGKLQGVVNRLVLLDTLDENIQPSVSGGVSIDWDTGMVTITGDGSFTAAGLPE